jgi:hypothetical protein
MIYKSVISVLAYHEQRCRSLIVNPSISFDDFVNLIAQSFSLDSETVLLKYYDEGDFLNPLNDDFNLLECFHTVNIAPRVLQIEVQTDRFSEVSSIDCQYLTYFPNDNNGKYFLLPESPGIEEERDPCPSPEILSIVPKPFDKRNQDSFSASMNNEILSFLAAFINESENLIKEHDKVAEVTYRHIGKQVGLKSLIPETTYYEDFESEDSCSVFSDDTIIVHTDIVSMPKCMPFMMKSVGTSTIQGGTTSVIDIGTSFATASVPSKPELRSVSTNTFDLNCPVGLSHCNCGVALPKRKIFVKSPAILKKAETLFTSKTCSYGFILCGCRFKESEKPVQKISNFVSSKIDEIVNLRKRDEQNTKLRACPGYDIDDLTNHVKNFLSKKETVVKLASKDLESKGELMKKLLRQAILRRGSVPLPSEDKFEEEYDVIEKVEVIETIFNTKAI